MVNYIVILILILLGIIVYDLQRSHSKRGSALYWFICIYMILLISFSSDMGNDLKQYIIEYSELPQLNSLSFSDLQIGGKRQPLWIYFNGFTKIFGNHFNIFLFFHALVVNYIIFYFIRKFSSYKFSVVLIYYLSLNFFYFNIDIQRESLAIATFLIGFIFLEKKKYIYYYILCIASFLFHASAIFTFLLPLIFRFFEIKNKFVFTIVFVAIVILGWNLSQFISIFNAIEYTTGVVDQFENYNSKETNLLNLILSSLLQSIPYIIFLSIYSLGHKTDKNTSIFYLAAFFDLLLTLCGPGIVGLYRLHNYMFIPYYIFIIQVCYQRGKTANQKLLLTMAFSLMATLQVFHYNKENVHNLGHKYYEMYFPYRNIFD